MALMPQYLHCANPPALTSSDILCVALAHNEAALLPEFLSHYRALGVSRFLIVNDRSTDGTDEILSQSEDVTVFTPCEGSTYKEHKRFWRAEILDQYGTGKWCVVPDIDEHLIFEGMGSRHLPDVVADLEREGAEAVQATMVDMYSDVPFNEARYTGGSLTEAFPFFDGPDHHFRLIAPRRFRKKYPTPDHMVFGGVRQRLFLPLDIYGNSWRERFFRGASTVNGGFGFRGASGLAAYAARALIKSRLKKRNLFNLTKVPLVRWRKGWFYYNGAHALSAPARLSREKMALLHFCFAAGSSGFEHKAARGEHANGSEFYQKMLHSDQARRSSPVFTGTEKYTSEKSLGSFIGRS